MTFKIWHKLALLLIVTITLSVVISTGLSQLSFKSSFLEYVERQEQQELDNLANNLLIAYEKNNNWAFIRNKKRVWFFYLRVKPEHMKAKPFQGGSRPFRRVERQERFTSRHDNRSLIRALPADDKPFRANNRRNKFALVDENKKIIVGSIMPWAETEFYPIKSGDNTVAYIQRKKFSGITARLDKIFASKQNQAFLFNTLITLFISILVALIISIYFRKRINTLTKIAQELTSGNYQQRVLIKQKDELGQLGMDFNTLAKTLEKNRHSQQRWLADISHELRTPLAILKGELQALDDGIRPINQVAIRSLSEETERLNQLVEDLYQLSISDMGALKYEKKYFNLIELIKDLKKNFTLLFDDKHLKLSIDYGDATQIMLYGDLQRLYQLMSNLLKNSLRYTDKYGQVSVHCLQEDNNIVITISDSSPGVAKDKLVHIFERLYRVENSRSRSKGGAGLGLAIAQQIVLAHDGEIYAQASELGGLTMTILFPYIKN